MKAFTGKKARVSTKFKQKMSTSEKMVSIFMLSLLILWFITIVKKLIDSKKSER